MWDWMYNFDIRTSDNILYTFLCLYLIYPYQCLYFMSFVPLYLCILKGVASPLLTCGGGRSRKLSMWSGGGGIMNNTVCFGTWLRSSCGFYQVHLYWYTFTNHTIYFITCGIFIDPGALHQTCSLASFKTLRAYDHSVVSPSNLIHRELLIHVPMRFINPYLVENVIR